jgi:hypothetical protein
MSKRAIALLAMTVGITFMLLAPAVVAGQSSQAGGSWTPPRTPDGQPDMQGIWSEEQGGADGTNVETSFQTIDTLRVQGWSEERIKARKPISAIVDVPGGKIPYQPWAEARRQYILARYGGDEITAQAKTRREINPEISCILGMPRLAYWQDFQFTQGAGYVVQSWERTRAYRIIPLGGQPHAPARVKLHMGDARGRWEGNTLVVNTTNFNDWTWFDSKGTIHTDALTLDERYTFVDANTIRYEVTATDPKALTRPFTMRWTLKRQHTPGDGYEILESACAEGERGLEAILGKEH